jgi:hypothetical protein
MEASTAPAQAAAVVGKENRKWVKSMAKSCAPMPRRGATLIGCCMLIDRRALATADVLLPRCRLSKVLKPLNGFTNDMSAANGLAAAHADGKALHLAQSGGLAVLFSSHSSEPEVLRCAMAHWPQRMHMHQHARQQLRNRGPSKSRSGFFTDRTYDEVVNTVTSQLSRSGRSHKHVLTQPAVQVAPPTHGDQVKAAAKVVMDTLLLHTARQADPAATGARRSRPTAATIMSEAPTAARTTTTTE